MQSILRREHVWHAGWSPPLRSPIPVSSHFFLRTRHVQHPFWLRGMRGGLARGSGAGVLE
ncbi:hypothetical protein B0H10DRAFT_2135666 [Mycena sp. CBHHK59/15]|nr:hypothetical protein B0H10DRAFT_2135666 [Mycena sp. CBHHK59/15]